MSATQHVLLPLRVVASRNLDACGVDASELEKALVAALKLTFRWGLLRDVQEQKVIEARRLAGNAMEVPSANVDVPYFAEFWGESERSTYRALSRFRQAFPGELDPRRLLVCCRAWDRASGMQGLCATTVYASRRGGAAPLIAESNN